MITLNKSIENTSFHYHLPHQEKSEPEKPGSDAFLKAPEEKEWLVLVYAEGRHLLADSTLQAINRMEEEGSSADVHIVAQATVKPTLAERLVKGIRGFNTRRYYIQQDSNKDLITSPMLEEFNEQAPLNAGNLADFISWGMKAYPAKKILVIIKKHGMGFKGDSRKTPLGAEELSQSLQEVTRRTGRDVDVIAFDSCSMQQLEVACQLKDHASVMTGASEAIFSKSFPYEKVLAGLKKDAAGTDAAAMGKIIVESYARTPEYQASRTMQTAVNLKKLEKAGAAAHQLVDSLISEKIPREIIYTNMMKAPSTEPAQIYKPSHDFRDMITFLENLEADPRIASAAVREKAAALREVLNGSIISHYPGGAYNRSEKNPRGFSAYLPWKTPPADMRVPYETLRFETDGSWLRLLDYVFQPSETPKGPPAVLSEPADTTLSIPGRAGKYALSQYKKYVSAYLERTCKHTPSCSQYSREAIEKHGLVEGSKLTFMRLITCRSDSESRGYDPVPDAVGGTIESNVKGSPSQKVEEPLPELILEPPAPVRKSKFRQLMERSIAALFMGAGMAAGGFIGALVGGASGALLGGYLGARAGTDTIDSINLSLVKKYRQESVKQFVKLEHVTGDLGYRCHDRINRLTGSSMAANLLGGAVGTFWGALKGMIGGAVAVGSEASGYMGLWARNRVTEKMDSLPPHYRTRQIIGRDYQNAPFSGTRM